MEHFVIAALVLLSVVVLLLLVLILRTEHSGRNTEMKLLERLNSIQNQYYEHSNSLLVSIEERMRSMSEKNRVELEKMRSLLDKELNQHLSSRLHESFSQVTKSLEGVQRGLGEMNAIAKDTKALRDILGNVKNRGIFGEILLGRLLSDILAPHQYVENLALGRGKFVEYAVKLPGKTDEPVYLPIDSKFPMESYRRIVDAKENVELASARKELYRAVKEFAKQIAAYIQIPKTTDFALMFLPTEGLYAEVLQNFELVEEVRDKYSVLIVSATTLSGFLASLQSGFKTLAIEKKSQEVWNILSAVKREFKQFEATLLKAKMQMEFAENTMEDLLAKKISRMNKVLRQVELPDEESANGIFGEDVDGESDGVQDECTDDALCV